MLEKALAAKRDKVKHAWTISDSGKLKKSVSFKGKPAVEDEKLFVIGKFRIYIFKSGTKALKLEQDGHILELQEIHSPNSKEVDLKFKGFVQSISCEATIEIIAGLKECFLRNFPTRPNLSFVIKLDYPANLPDTSSVEMGACGGFVRTYKCVSGVAGVPPCADVVWDVNNLFELNNNKEFNLSDFQAPSYLQLRVLLETLKFNVWFTSLTLNLGPLKFDPEIALSVAASLKDNNTITKLVLSGITSPTPFLTLGKDLSQNKSLQHLEFNMCDIGDKGAAALANDFLAFRHLKSFKLIKCKLGKVGIQTILKCLEVNGKMIDNLEELDLSYNKFEGEGIIGLSTLLEKAKLKKVDISYTGAKWAQLKLRNPVKYLESLVIHGEKFIKKDTIQAFVTFLSSIPNLGALDLSRCGFASMDALKQVLSVVPHLKKLNLSHLPLGDAGITNVCQWLVGPQPLLKECTELGLNMVFGERKKYRRQCIQALTALISRPVKLPLKILHLQGDPTNPKNRLGSDLIPITYQLLVNESIQEIDISGHLVGDELALSLSKVVQANHTLRALIWDDNGTGASAFRKFKNALSKNKTLLKMPIPYHDLHSNLRDEKVRAILPKLDAIVEEIQTIINLNHERYAKTQLAKTRAKEPHSSPSPTSPSLERARSQTNLNTWKAPANSKEPQSGRVLFSYEASDARMINLEEGKLITVLDRSFHPDWWKVQSENLTGLAPSNHIQLMNKDEIEKFKKEEEAILYRERERKQREQEELARMKEERAEEMERMKKENEERERVAEIARKQDEERRAEMDKKEKEVREKPLPTPHSKDDGPSSPTPSRNLNVSQQVSHSHSHTQVEYKTNPKIYSIPLRELIEKDGTTIPKFVEAAIERILGSVNEEGLFRVPGSIAIMTEIRNTLESGNLRDYGDYLKGKDEHAVSSLLKQFLRELPDPLVPYALYQKLAQLEGSRDKDSYVHENVLGVIEDLPKCNKDLLERLSTFLMEVAAHSNKNLMTQKNIALVFGPCFFRSPLDAPIDMSEIAKFSDVCYLVFSALDKKRKKSVEEVRGDDERSLLDDLTKSAGLLLPKGIVRKAKKKINPSSAFRQTMRGELAENTQEIFASGPDLGVVVSEPSQSKDEDEDRDDSHQARNDEDF